MEGSFAGEPVVAFVGVEPSKAIRDYVLEKVELVTRVRGVEGCRVVLEAHNHAHAGRRFRAKVELRLANTMLVVGSAGEAFSDLYAAIDDAALGAMRLIHERYKRQHRFPRA